MGRSTEDNRFLVNEAQSLLIRLDTVKPFALNTPMVRAAAISSEAQNSISELLNTVSLDVKNRVLDYIKWLNSKESHLATVEQAQGQYSVLKLRFNNLLDQLDIFADVLSQRGEHSTGVWLAGLDVLATDSLALPGNYFDSPPIVCFLERGHGAAIRRARTRLPGGDTNPVAVIQVPRERLVGSGIASSIIHEVGHQGAALLDLVNSLKETVTARAEQGTNTQAWQLLNRWMSEIVADFWAVAHVGISGTLGLMGVVSLPSYFVFRISMDTPHPFPWIRVKISKAIGKALYPHKQWDEFNRRWEALYPTAKLETGKNEIIAELEEILPEFASLLVTHRPESLKGKMLFEVFPISERQPQRLQQIYDRWKANPKLMETATPTLVFAVLGQARSDGRITSREESKLLTYMLTRWALLRSQHYCVGGKRPTIDALQHGELNYSKQQLNVI